jgi:uncharacterized protein (UPF0276 family)
LRRIALNVARMQDALDRPVLIENPALYLDLEGHDLSEVEFLTELVSRTGCGLLVDVNNVHVSASNLGFSAEAYLDAIPAGAVGEIHLAGHAADERMGECLLIDTHGAAIARPVWVLYHRFLARIGPRPTLIERDDNIPDFAELIAERNRADGVLEQVARPREPAHA